jgi:hypothetical protein
MKLWINDEEIMEKSCRCSALFCNCEKDIFRDFLKK